MRSNKGQEEAARHINGSSSGSNGKSRGLKVLIERRCLVPLTQNDDVCDDHDNNNNNVLWRYSSYQKLPQLQYLKLSVLKLDGSVFDVIVVKNATVGELKKGIEQVFSSSSKEGQDSISWSVVWGHFCLCYEGQKLINDKAHVRNYGIKEGDQLQFIRHMSINNYSPLKKTRPKKESIAWKNDSVLSSGDMIVGSEGKENDQEYNFKCPAKEDDEENAAPQSKMANILRGLLSYHKWWGVSSKGPSSDCRTSRPSRFSTHFLRT